MRIPGIAVALELGERPRSRDVGDAAEEAVLVDRDEHERVACPRADVAQALLVRRGDVVVAGHRPVRRHDEVAERVVLGRQDGTDGELGHRRTVVGPSGAIPDATAGQLAFG
jgi:hypothetical protein